MSWIIENITLLFLLISASLSMFFIMMYAKPFKTFSKFDSNKSFINNLINRYDKFNFKENVEKSIITADLQDTLTLEKLILRSIMLYTIIFLFFVIMVKNIFLGLIFGFLGFYLNFSNLKNKKEIRQKKIIKDLPYFLDMLSLSVEGGMGPRVALRTVPTYLKSGILKNELGILINDINNGESESDALKKLAMKLDIPELKDFSSAFARVVYKGGSIKETLRVQSDMMRRRRLEIAEEAGKQAEIKMTLPMIFLIFPVILILFFGPMVISFFINKG